jgi:8-oxo-dGTP pyrophosphatase MutT (NUDIX family)
MTAERTDAPEHAGAAASSTRLPTGHPDRYLIPRAQVPPGLLDRVELGGEMAVPRPAATIVLARQAGSGPEVLLLRRPNRSSFAANAWVFPGGALDPADLDGSLAARLRGPSPDAWAKRLGTGSRDAVGFVVAAIREGWEETGILLSDPPADLDLLRPARAEALAGEISFGEVLEREGLVLDAGELVYLAHWITPEPEPRRFDARFFLAAVPRATRCDLLGGELMEARWTTPAAAVDAYGAGAMRLLPPTVHTLRRLSTHASVADMVAELRHAPVGTILPRMIRDPEGVIIELPGD